MVQSFDAAWLHRVVCDKPLDGVARDHYALAHDNVTNSPAPNKPADLSFGQSHHRRRLPGSRKHRKIVQLNGCRLTLAFGRQRIHLPDNLLIEGIMREAQWWWLGIWLAWCGVSGAMEGIRRCRDGSSAAFPFGSHSETRSGVADAAGAAPESRTGAALHSDTRSSCAHP